MLHRIDVRSILLALAFAACGFLIADRMAAANARPVPVEQGGAGAFAGTAGTVAVGEYVVIVRDSKVYRINIGERSQSGKWTPWMVLD